MSKIDISDGDILTAVALLKLVFGRDRKITSVLNKIDSPEEIARVRQPITDVLNLINEMK